MGIGKGDLRYDQENWECIQALVEKAVGLPDDAKTRFLEEIGHSDTKLRLEVESLLETWDLSGQILDKSPVLEMIEGGSESGHDPASSTPVQDPSGYRILSEIHRGGQGVVYKAIQLSTKREVAIKFMLGTSLAASDNKRRFEREVELIGRLKHPWIVPVFDSGLADHQYFYVMDYIEGVRLDQYVMTRGLGLRRILELFVKVCDAVNHAHQKGVIHRDLKPSNILVDESENPHVLDFGLAKLGDRSWNETISMSGQIMGTLAYMSPEQAAGKIDLVGTSSDVYSLGVVLYQLLTGRLPYNVNTSLPQGLTTIQNVEPSRELLSKSRVDGEVSTIVFKALSKESDRRYPIAGMLGDDLRSYLRGEPIEAKRDSAFYVLRKQLRRHWIAAAASAAFAILLVTATILSTTLFLVANQARDDADRNARAFEIQRDESYQRRDEMARMRDASVEQLYTAEMNLAGEALSNLGGISRVREITNRWFAQKEYRGLLGWESHYLRSRCRLERKMFRHEIEVWCVRWHPRKDILAFGDAMGRVWVWDLESEPTLVGKLDAFVRALAWSQDGAKLAAGASIGGVKVWDSVDGTLLVALANVGNVLDIAWRPGRPNQLACATGAKVLDVYDLLSEKRIARFENKRGMQTVQWDSSGDRLLAACHDRTYRVFDVDQQEEISVAEPGGKPVFSAFWEKGENRIAFVDTGGQVGLADSDGSQIVWSQNVGRSLWRLSWDKEGDRFATVGADRTLRIWDVTENPSRVILSKQYEGHEDEVWGLDWNRDSSLIATSGVDRTIRIWAPSDRAVDRAKLLPQRGKFTGLTTIDWSKRGDRIAATGVSGELQIWDVERDFVQSNGLHPGATDCLEWSHDGTRTVTGANDERVVIWDVDRNTAISVFTGFRDPDKRNPVHAARWSSDDQLVATSSHDGSIYVLQSDSCEVVAFLKDSEIPYDLCWHPSERRLAFVSETSLKIKVWDFENETLPQTVYESPAYIRSLDWSPDKKWLAAGRQDGWIDLIDTKDWSVRFTLKDHTSTVEDLEFSPDSQRLASAGFDGTVRIWDSRRGKQTLAIATRTKNVKNVAWGPKGRRLAYVGAGDSVVILNASRSYDESAKTSD